MRDLSRTSVSISPAEYSTWAAARSELIRSAKRPLKAQLESELSAAANDDEISQIRAQFTQKESAIEHEIDHKPMDVHLSLNMAYKYDCTTLTLV